MCRALEGIEVEGGDCYLPTAPDKLVVGIQRDSGVALQSAAKAPFLLAFDVRDRGGGPAAVHTQGCIFKVRCKGSRHELGPSDTANSTGASLTLMYEV